MSRRLWQTLVAILVVLGACSNSGKPSGNGATPTQVTVAISAFPIQWLVESVGGDRVRTIELVSTASELHEAELEPSALTRLGEADIVVLVGSGVQPAVEEALSARGVAERRVLRLADELVKNGIVDPNRSAVPRSDYSGLAPAAEQGQPDTSTQIHFWLDPVAQEAAANYLSQTLGSVSPENADYFSARLEKTRSALNSLHESYAQRLTSCRSRTLVVYHSAFKATADRYGLEEVPLTGADPEAEPKPSQVRAAIEAAKTSGVKAVFSDPGAGREVMEQVAREAGTSIEVLDPLEASSFGPDYDSRMRSNLEKIARSLGCEGMARAQ